MLLSFEDEFHVQQYQQIRLNFCKDMLGPLHSHHVFHLALLLCTLFIVSSYPTSPPPLHFNLSHPRTALASASLFPAFILFAGGRTSNGRSSDVVDIFNTRRGTHLSGSFLSVARADMAAASIAFNGSAGIDGGGGGGGGVGGVGGGGGGGGGEQC
jgi:hypothetical protein